MSNQIIPLNNSDQIPANVVFFVKVNYFYTPFFGPSRDTILGALRDSDEIVVSILDVQFDDLNNPTCKCLINGVDSLTTDLADQYVMNVFQYISSNITRLVGLSISNNFFTSDDNFPDTGSTLTPDLGSGTTVNPSGTDLQNQASGIVDSISNTLSNVKNSLPSTTTLITILIILVVGVIAIGFAEAEA